MRGLIAWFRGLPSQAVVIAAAPWAACWLFAWAFAESSFFPLPPDVLLIAMCLARPPHSFVFALVCMAGSVLGGVFGYALGFYGGQPLAARLMKAERLAAAERMYQKYDVLAIGIAGFTPIPYKVFTILSGLLNVRIWRFVAASALSRGARFFVVAGFLYFFGGWAKAFIDRYFGLLTLLVAIGVVAGLVIFGCYSRRKRQAGSDAPG